MVIVSSSRSKSSQGQSHFEINFIPESNGKCLDFYPEAGSRPSTECILVLMGGQLDRFIVPRCLSDYSCNY